MTRPHSQIAHTLALHSCGLSSTEIGERLGIPRRTVWDWTSGLLPWGFSGDRAACTTCGGVDHRFEDLPPEYVYLLGLYLGDGSIASHPRGVYRLRLTLDAAYPGIIAEAVRATIAILPRNKVGRLLRPDRAVEVSCYSKSWPCLFPQHGPGKKHLRRIALTEWQQHLVDRHAQLLLRGLIHSDGCRFINTGRDWRCPRYSFTNFSSDIRGIFTDACDLLGLRWTTSVNVVYVSRKADVDRIDRFIGPKA